MADITPLPSAGERPERFEVDRRTLARIDSDSYTGSGYDRGHLALNYAHRHPLRRGPPSAKRSS
ncbi:MAG: hypothetical protein J6386_19555 [Candidatus Synoicihabitans palmerolidicus]|nr:hypothetical protein [Candidatus Synoicihabitans palmerolidicus]